MKTKKKIVFFLVFILTSNCSFDNKTGIWNGEREIERIGVSEKEQINEESKEQDSSFEQIYSSDDLFTKEITLTKTITLSSPKKNLSWKMSSLNYQNFLGNIHLSGIDSIFLKEKIGKNKFSTPKIISSPLIYEDNIIFSDNNGTIFNINQSGTLNWKKNIYKKVYKKIYKSLVFAVYKNNLFIADNIGFIYSINLATGETIWIKNHGIPLKSNIKVYDDKIILINQENRIFCLDSTDGKKLWDVRSISSFIKLQNFLSSSISQEGELLVINSSGELIKINITDGRMKWAFNTLGSSLLHDADFFKSSKVVINDDDIILSIKSSLFSYDLATGFNNWKQEVSTNGTPIIVGDNIFLVTSNGFFVIIDNETGRIISSSNILNLLKNKKQKTRITGFVMGSGKVYSTTANGFLIVASATSGKADFFTNIGDPIASSPVISNGNLYILTKNSRILGFN